MTALIVLTCIAVYLLVGTVVATAILHELNRMSRTAYTDDAERIFICCLWGLIWPASFIAIPVIRAMNTDRAAEAERERILKSPAYKAALRELEGL